MRITAFVATSIDGYIADQNGNIDWLERENQRSQAIIPQEEYGYFALLQQVDCIVMGRKSFDFVATFDPWPYPNNMVMVLSRNSLTLPPHLQSMSNVQTHCGDILSLQAELEKRQYQHIYVDGGQLISSYLHLGILTDIIITQVPVILGKGIPLFDAIILEDKAHHPQLQQCRSFPSGFLQMHYIMS